jgi:hypothetical protein
MFFLEMLLLLCWGFRTALATRIYVLLLFRMLTMYSCQLGLRDEASVCSL